MRQELIEQYIGGGKKLAEAIAGLTVAALCARPADGSWSIQQIVIHLLDSDLTMLDRMKRIIAMDEPALLAYDQEKFAGRLYYERQASAEAVEIIDRGRRLFAPVLAALPEAAWGRRGIHSERGPLALEQVLQGAVGHLEHHLKFIQDKRATL